MPDRPLVTILIPARNEEESFPALEQAIEEALRGVPCDFEFIVLDNASTDRTPELARALCERDPRWKYMRFSRDFNVEASMSAGYRVASGDAIVVLYSDLQDPPEVIPRFIEKWQEGWDVVYGVRKVRPGEARWRNLAVSLAYRTIAWFSEVPIPRNAGDFRLISRRVRDALDQCGEYNRYMRGLIAWLGFNQVGIEYERRPRFAGSSKAPFFALVTFVFSAITSFSLRPLRLFSVLGLSLLTISLASIPVYVVLFAIGNPPPGITTLIVLALLAIGINSLGIGILGEYLGRTYAETKRRPLYVVEDSVNLDLPPGWTDRSVGPLGVHRPAQGGPDGVSQ